jgi:hydroxymethylbilane synthase
LLFEPVRGNIETRLRKLREGRFAALILAYAGMKRLGYLEYIAEVIPLEICLPAVGQGALGIEIRRGEVETEALVSRLNNLPSFLAVTAERSFLRRLEGGCQVPVAALAEIEADELHLQGVVASLDGATILRGEERGPLDKAQAVGIALAEKLLSEGAADILRKIRWRTGEYAAEQ